MVQKLSQTKMMWQYSNTEMKVPVPDEPPIDVAPRFRGLKEDIT